MLRMEKDEAFQHLVVQQDNTLSQCSTGCQSGWTLYLCQSQNIPASLHEEEEVDLSMLSDASSGPPRVPKDDYLDFYCYSDAVHGCSLTSFADKGGKRRRVEEHSSLLDDTASSPLLCFSMTSSSSNSSCKTLQLENVLDLSCGFSATHFKGKTAMQKHLDYTAPLNPAPICRQEGQRKSI